jgi:hypothetical protein
MNRHGRLMAWTETTLAVLSGVTLVLTMITREWVELIFGVDPDHADGSLEWAILGGLLTTTVLFSLLAYRRWLQLRLT